MGFYAPAQLVADARKAGVTVLPVDVNKSDWDCTLENRCQVRLGLCMVKGLSLAEGERVSKLRREHGPYRNLAEFTRRVGCSASVLTILADADAFHSLSNDRRAAIWQSLAQEKTPRPRPCLRASMTMNPCRCNCRRWKRWKRLRRTITQPA